MDTPAQTIARVQARLDDPDFTFYTLEDYVRSYNDALDEIAERTEIRERYVYVKRKKWAPFADLRGVLPPNALRITSVWNPSSSKWLEATHPREMDNTVGRKWEANIGTSRWWFMRGLWFVVSYPVTPNDISPLKIYYTSMFDHVSIDGGQVGGLNIDLQDIPPDFTTAIENYMLYDLLAERKEVKKSLEFFQRFSDQIPSLRDMAENRMRRDRTPRMGARRAIGPVRAT